jgi:uncharacterized protein (DUF58 family)
VSAAPARRRTFPLVPRRPLAGTAFGSVRSSRRGAGTDVVGSRPYAPGDRLASIDWAASARLSTATGGDDFVVRQTRADDAPEVIVAVDRSPSMALAPADLPFLSKPAAVREVVAAIVASARAARAEIGWLDVGPGGTQWIAPKNVVSEAFVAGTLARPHDAPAGSVGEALRALARHQVDARPGTFVFLVSDFLAPPPRSAWLPLLRRGLDPVPVRVQDPVWEASFPDAAGVLLPVGDPAGGRAAGIVLTPAQVRSRRDANEVRHAGLLAELRGLGVDVVDVDDAAAAAVDAAFARWAARRRALARAGGAR